MLTYFEVSLVALLKGFSFGSLNEPMDDPHRKRTLLLQHFSRIDAKWIILACNFLIDVSKICKAEQLMYLGLVRDNLSA